MYCSNGSSSMATLLQQKNFMKKLSNGSRNVVVTNDGSNSQNNPNLTTVTNNNAVATATATTTVASTSRLMLPHEVGAMITPPLIASNAIGSAAGAGVLNSYTNQFQYNQHLNYNNQYIQQSHSSYNNITNHNSYQHNLFNNNNNNSNHHHNHQQQTYDAHQNNFRPTSSEPPPLVSFQTPTTIGKSTNSNSSLVHTNSNSAIVNNISNENTVEEEQVETAAEAVAPQEDADAEPEPEVDIVINNVVCSFSVRCHLNLRDIALRGVNVEFRRENGMVTMKLRRPYTTASIWSSGRITCTGATSEDQAKIAARRYARCLQNLGFKARFQNFRVVNVLGTCSMPWAIKIVNFSEKYKKDASYEPELHPGVTYKIKSPKATLKIFSTGSITVTANSVANVQAAIEHIFPLVYEFRKKRVKVEPPTPRAAVEAKNKEVKSNKRRRPPGKADNDPVEDNMYVSDVEVSDDEN